MFGFWLCRELEYLIFLNYLFMLCSVWFRFGCLSIIDNWFFVLMRCDVMRMYSVQNSVPSWMIHMGANEAFLHTVLCNVVVPLCLLLLLLLDS